MSLLDLQAQATTRLGLEPIKNPNGNGYLWEGCVPTRVTDILVKKQEPHKKGEFIGIAVPILQIEFENLKLNESDPDRFYSYQLKIVGTKETEKGTTDRYIDRPIADIENGTQTLWKSIKHFLESLSHSPNYRNIANISKEDQLKYFDLPGIAPAEERVAKYEEFFNYIVNFVLGDGTTTKSQILDAKGEALPMWIKMLPNFDKDPKRNAKFYTIPTYIGQGVFEALKLNDKGLPITGPKIIRVKANESLALSTMPAINPAAAAQNISTLTPGGTIDPGVASLLR